MRRLLIITERFWPEEFIVNELASELAKQGFRVSVLTQQPSYPRGRTFPGRANHAFSREFWNGVLIYRFKTILGYRESLFYKLFNYIWFCACGVFWAFLMSFRCDRVLIYHTGPLTMAVPGVVLSRLFGRPTAIWTQDIWPDSVYAYGFRRSGLLVWALNGFVRWVYDSMDVVMISSAGFRDILSKFTRKPMLEVPNWPMVRYESVSDNGMSSSKSVFLFAGNVGKLQNLHKVIEGYSAALRIDPSVGQLRIVGDGSDLTSLMQQAERGSVPLVFPGRKTGIAMKEEYGEATILVIALVDAPALRLTVPSKFQAYLSVAKPILCIAAGEVARLVQELRIGVTCDPNDASDIARGFLEMAHAAPAVREEWSRNARSALESSYEPRLLLGKIRNVLVDLRDG
jgi:glycosyltransferase involved in cell wall biosynthesis